MRGRSLLSSMIDEESDRLLVTMVAVSVSILIAGRQDGHAVGIGYANRNRRPVRGEFTEGVVSEQRQMRLAGAVVNHTEDARVRIEVGRCSSGGNAGGYLAVHENIAS